MSLDPTSPSPSPLPPQGYLEQIRIRSFRPEDENAVLRLITEGLKSYGCRDFNQPNESGWIQTLNGPVPPAYVRHCFDNYVERVCQEDLRDIMVHSRILSNRV